MGESVYRNIWGKKRKYKKIPTRGLQGGGGGDNAIWKSAKAPEMNSLLFPPTIFCREIGEGRPPGPEPQFGAIAQVLKAAKNWANGSGWG